MRVLVKRLYEHVISMIEGWLEDINHYRWVKKGCPMLPTLLGICIDKLEACLEENGCARTTLARKNSQHPCFLCWWYFSYDIVSSNLDEQLRILNLFSSCKSMSVNTDETKLW